MEKKYKGIVIGSGVLAFGIVMYAVIKKYRKSMQLKQKPKDLKCPAGYNASNGKCVKSNTNTNTNTNDTGYTSYSGDYYTLNTDYTSYSGDYMGNTISGFQVQTRNGSRLRKEPNTSSDIIKTYDAGVLLYVIDESPQADGTWYKVQEISPDGMVKREGWMRSDVIHLIEE